MSLSEDNNLLKSVVMLNHKYAVAAQVLLERKEFSLLSEVATILAHLKSSEQDLMRIVIAMDLITEEDTLTLDEILASVGLQVRLGDTVLKETLFEDNSLRANLHEALERNKNSSKEESGPVSGTREPKARARRSRRQEAVVEHEADEAEIEQTVLKILVSGTEETTTIKDQLRSVYGITSHVDGAIIRGIRQRWKNGKLTV